MRQMLASCRYLSLNTFWVIMKQNKSQHHWCLANFKNQVTSSHKCSQHKHVHHFIESLRSIHICYHPCDLRHASLSGCFVSVCKVRAVKLRKRFSYFNVLMCFVYLHVLSLVPVSLALSVTERTNIRNLAWTSSNNFTQFRKIFIQIVSNTSKYIRCYSSVCSILFYLYIFAVLLINTKLWE